MFFGLKSDKVKINILEGVSGIIKPCRYVNTKNSIFFFAILSLTLD